MSCNIEIFTDKHLGGGGDVFNTTFNNISVISDGQFYWWGKPEYPEKTTDLSQVTDKLNKMSIGDIHRCDFYYNAIAAC